MNSFLFLFFYDRFEFWSILDISQTVTQSLFEFLDNCTNINMKIEFIKVFFPHIRVEFPHNQKKAFDWHIWAVHHRVVTMECQL